MLKFVWNWVPWTGVTDVLFLITIVLVTIPLAAISADRSLKLMRANRRT